MATIGPACCSEEMLETLALEGMNVARLNMVSGGTAGAAWQAQHDGGGPAWVQGVSSSWRRCTEGALGGD